jgi:hypothetical protein
MSYVLALKKQKCKNEPQPQDVHSKFKSHEERERYIISVNFHMMIWNVIYFACEPDTTSKLGSRRSQMRQQQNSASFLTQIAAPLTKNHLWERAWPGNTTQAVRFSIGSCGCGFLHRKRYSAPVELRR